MMIKEKREKGWRNLGPGEENLLWKTELMGIHSLNNLHTRKQSSRARYFLDVFLGRNNI